MYDIDNSIFFTNLGAMGTFGSHGGKGGKGGDGGEGGYSGSIKINDETVQQMTEQTPDSDKGKCGAGGLRGKDGKNAGDTAYMDTIWGVQDIAHGFNYDQKLSIKYHSVKPSQPPRVLCYYYGNQKDCWAEIINHGSKNVSKTFQQEEKNEVGRDAEKKSAVHKKEILANDLSENIVQIRERNQALGSFLDEMFEKLTDNSKNLRELGEEAASEAEQSEEKQERIEAVRRFERVKNATAENEDSQEILTDICTSTLSRMSCKCCQQYPHLKFEENFHFAEKIELPPELKARCLLKCSTLDDANNILHCIFGVKNSDEIYVCDSWQEKRKEMSELVEHTEDKSAMTSIAKKFVLSIESDSYPTARKIKQEHNDFKKQKNQLWNQIMKEIENPQNECTKEWILPEKSIGREKDVDKKMKKALSNCSASFQDKLKKILRKFEWETACQHPKCKLEYTEFIGQQTETLGRGELELISLLYGLNINIFREESCEEGERNLKFVEAFNDTGHEEHFILMKEDGSWQKLEWDKRLKTFYEMRWLEAKAYKRHLNDRLTSENGFKDVVKFFQQRNAPDEQKKIKQLDPEFGIPEAISLQILQCYKANAVQISTEDLCFLIEKIVSTCISYDQDEFAFLFLNIIKNVCPHAWKYELLILEMEDSLEVVFDFDDKKVMRECLQKIGSKMFALIKVQLIESQNLKSDRLKDVLYLLSNDLRFTKMDFDRLKSLPLNDWIYELKIKFWEYKIESLQNIHFPGKAKKREVVYLLLELENSKGFKFCEKLLSEENLSWTKLKSALYASEERTNGMKERSFCEILDILNKEGQISNHDTLRTLQSKLQNEVTFKNPDCDGKQWARNKKKTLTFPEDSDEFLSVYNSTVFRIMGFYLRHTQQLTILSILSSQKNTLCQVSTGEGKSLIVAGVAIARALSGKKVDVLTSNSLLAVRDSTQDVRNGGLLDIFEAFDISVSNNCSSNEEDRKKAYNADVVYGELSNFQRDHLLQTFYARNIKGDRTSDYVLVDEVDCMLLDNGNNILFLSHNVPGLESLESLSVYIWEKVNLYSANLEEIKSDIFYDLYGEINKNNFDVILSPSKTTLQVKNSMWSQLIKDNIIDRKGRLQLNKLEDIKVSKFHNFKKELIPKLVFFFQNIFQRQRSIKVPKHLSSFIDQHLDVWLSNAVQAMLLNPDEHYVVDKDRSNTSNDFSPQVIIIDPNTGTDQNSSQWDGSLHQFLQLKEGCQITTQSLKAVFVSNVSYIRLYKNFAGLSGTLGTNPERDYLLDIYSADYIIVPTAFPKRFITSPAKILNSRDTWMAEVLQEAKTTIGNNRSIVIFCDSISSVKLFHDFLKRKQLVPEEKLHAYTRDYQKFTFESENLKGGHIIVSTNLAGRGTDIKLSKSLRDNLGLHICLTYLPENLRIEEQAFGRSARKGEPGSGILILLDQNSPIHQGKIFEMKTERNRKESNHISELKENYENNVKFQETCFKKFSLVFKRLKERMDNLRLDAEVKDFVCKSAIDFWALLIDTIDSEKMKNQSHKNISHQLDEELKKIRVKGGNLEEIINSALEWTKSPARNIALSKYLATKKEEPEFLPARTIALSKYLATKKVEPEFSLAKNLLDKLIAEDEFWYPQAHYYKAFVLVNETEDIRNNMTPFIRELFATEKILDEHIQMQLMMSATVMKISSSKMMGTMLQLNAYKEQKENVVHLLEIFKGSINQLLGSPCSESGLATETGLETNRAKLLFQRLISMSFICHCEVTQSSTIPDRKNTIKSIAEDFGITESSIANVLNYLDSKQLTEVGLEKTLKKMDVFKCTREKFWLNLIEKGILTQSIDCIIVTKSALTNDMKPEKAIILKENQILYNPYPESLEQQEKIIFLKTEVKKWLGNSYQEKKKDFEKNEFAMLDKEKLQNVDLSHFGKLTMDDFKIEGIANSEERKKIWDLLIRENFIDKEGNFKSYETFCYPDCSAYESAVQNALQRKFVAVGIQQKWLKTDDASCKTAINVLPLKPHRTLLSELLDAHIISTPFVPISVDLNESGGLIGEVTDLLGLNVFIEHFPNKAERDLVLMYLRNHQAAYANLETVAASFKHISESIQESEAHKNIGTEIETFGCIGFDHLFELSEKKWSTKMMFRAAAVIAIGIAQVIVGAIIQIKSAGAMTHVASGFISEGISDIIFGISALMTGNNFTWADYGRHKLESMIITAGK